MTDNEYYATIYHDPSIMSSTLDRDGRPRGFARALRALRERWWVILITIVIVGGIAYGVSMLLETRYAATTQLVYAAREAQLVSQALSSSGGADSLHNVSRDATTLKTSVFAGRVSRAMGGSIGASELRSSVEVTADPQTDVISIKADAADPFQATDIADTFAAEFIQQRREEITGLLSETQGLVDARLQSLSPEEAASSYGITVRQQRDDLEILLSKDISDYEILEKATAPISPYFPRPFFNLLLGLGVGLVLGLILATILDRRDKRIKDQATLEDITHLPVIGALPPTSGRRSKKAPAGNRAVGFRQGNEALLESMRMLRSNLKVLGFGESKRSVLITSVGREAGKTTLAVNLALTMALAGDRVVLVDADFYNPNVHQYLRLPNDEGLSDVLLDRDVSWSTKIKAVELDQFVSPPIDFQPKSDSDEAPISKFLCMTGGPLLSNPAEVLESGAMTDMLAEFEGISDYVILDGPPLLAAPDTLALAQYVDALVLAGMLGRDTRAEAAQVRQLLERAELTALGIVMCGVKSQSREISYQHGVPQG
ncbi:MAG: hypothetical protein GX113_06400 [Actinobacteria bacterium]|jgi:Mrp family chromosome partitioning ATPase|nr:hypothetical protein [Actinomycetota bacterium]